MGAPVKVAVAGVGHSPVDRRWDGVSMDKTLGAYSILACQKAMASDDFARRELNSEHAVGELDLAKLNVNGGAIALGHPVGATGARLVLTLLMEMRRRDLGIGLAALCVGGGQGAAILLERS